MPASFALRRLIGLNVFLLAVAVAQCASDPTPTRSVTYKRVGNVELQLHVFEPATASADATPANRPAIVFFFGGGWKNGSPEQFFPQAQALADQGLVAISADYRVAERHEVEPRDCVADARSCLRWLRAHAAELNIDPQRIAAGGGSAGGHLAACTALTDVFDDPADDLSISPRPDALVLFNPVLDNGPDGYGYPRVKDDFPRISPAHHVAPGWPPTLVMLGTADPLIPVATMERFRDAMRDAGNTCELKLYPGAKHGFFNQDRHHGIEYLATLRDTREFLRQLGWITTP